MKLKIVDRRTRLIERAAELRERQTQIAAKMMQAAHREHIISVEREVERYRVDLVKTLESQRHAIELAKSDSGHLAIVLSNLTADLQRLAERYVPEACNLGCARALSDLKVRGFVRKIIGPARSDRAVVNGVLSENRTYLNESLLPDLHKVLLENEDAQKKIDAMRSRVASYAHYLWRAAERSYIVTARECMSKLPKKAREAAIELLEAGFNPMQPRGSDGKWTSGGYEGKKLAVFVLGASRSGKGTFGKHYTDEDGPYRIPKDHWIDSDKVKATMPLYSGKVGIKPGEEEPSPDAEGKYGPSGPKTWDEYVTKYSPEERQKMEDFIRENLPYKSSRDFAQGWLPDSNADGQGKNFDGGLTHEVSSAIAKNRKDQAIAHGESFVYDSTGSAQYPEWADQALKNGYEVHFRQAVAPDEVRYWRNATKVSRSPDPTVLASTKAKVDKIVPAIRSYVDERAAAGYPVSFRATNTFTKREHEKAVQGGYKS